MFTKNCMVLNTPWYCTEVLTSPEQTATGKDMTNPPPWSLPFLVAVEDLIQDEDDLVMLWSLVKEKFNSTEPTDDKEREIWVELKILFEPDTDDEVHHVSTEKEIDIYMLVEKEYPLSRGTLTLMSVAKLLVDQDNEMSRELLRKIFMQAERPKI
ncbi:hypothetical protein Tco_0800651 [Tanacetum coccineum]|uniref:Uncharacterized protein n=1 Tax=Tanacetum coccineum TaxID=301880 RepID=A0ABQ4ZY62_9ASTR